MQYTSRDMIEIIITQVEDHEVVTPGELVWQATEMVVVEMEDLEGGSELEDGCRK